LAAVPAIPGCASLGKTMGGFPRNAHEAIESRLSIKG
jgi:predicted RNase H-like HicB family nuclease